VLFFQYFKGNNYPVFAGSIGLKNIDLINKKANLGYWIDF
jgi:RimJ/RimL family protein N-acetyltransferase